MLAGTGVGWLAWWSGRGRIAASAVAVSFAAAAACLSAEASERALGAPLRQWLDRELGGFTLETVGPAPRHDPIPIRATLLEDAAVGDGFVSLRAEVTSAHRGAVWHCLEGRVLLTIGGALAREHVGEWRAGRTIEAPVAFRRPAQYLNAGVANLERDLALDGVTLFGSIKSGALVEVVAPASAAGELSAKLRGRVRHAVTTRVGRLDSVSAAIVTAVLIGDRSNLDLEVTRRLQAAGTYHVIAISGGNIAILAGLTLAVLSICGLRGRAAALVTALLLIAYAQTVSAGPSVWRATVMAVVYFAARTLDHRTHPVHVLSFAAALIVCARPLDVRDVGFVLTFGATATLLEVSRRLAGTSPRGWCARWIIASLAASAATELALLPVGAWVFSRVTVAGLVLNLVAVPAMVLVQVTGLIVVLADRLDAVASVAGWLAHAAARTLVESARLVDVAPWLSPRVAPPTIGLVVAYYGGLAVALMTSGVRRVAGVCVVAGAIGAVVLGQPSGWWHSLEAPETLRLVALDVGQGDATLVRFPDQSAMLVDAGGVPFGSGRFDVGERVVSPALWALGLRRLDRMILTHGDPDHAGGVPTVLGDFTPSTLALGVPVRGDARTETLLAAAQQAGTRVTHVFAGDTTVQAGVKIRVLHPEPPDWERRRVRNDDSIVLELLFGDVAVLLLGDVSALVERSLLPRLTPARRRILKVAHHGSRTSTSEELLDTWRPQVAIISSGRGNSFGHPTEEVLDRLRRVGARIYRTDLHGQVTVETDGTDVRVRTFMPDGAASVGG
jgi:competence protein ComEC